ncbi:ribosomal protein L14-domain-containing protein [Lipomyces orientalis]|uniref:Ribosomal protein L14-domain-containing protein n=1 Tax=Lipomyces orientalis TaxID=1233043 RepID=A0ACC3TZM7_9ASCO
MSEEFTTVNGSAWRHVEVGRVILINKGDYAGKLAAIVEIIDHKRVLIDGPVSGVPRQALPLAQATLTPIVIKLPRGARTGTTAKKWAEAGVDEIWAKSAWAQKIKNREIRWGLTDFERFQVLILKKQRRYEVKKTLAKAKRSA